MTEVEVINTFNRIDADLRAVEAFVSANSIDPRDGCQGYRFCLAQVRMNDLRAVATQAMVGVMQLAREANK